MCESGCACEVLRACEDGLGVGVRVLVRVCMRVLMLVPGGIAVYVFGSSIISTGPPVPTCCHQMVTCRNSRERGAQVVMGRHNAQAAVDNVTGPKGREYWRSNGTNLPGPQGVANGGTGERIPTEQQCSARTRSGGKRGRGQGLFPRRIDPPACCLRGTERACCRCGRDRLRRGRAARRADLCWTPPYGR